jgi:hypothetical protein
MIETGISSVLRLYSLQVSLKLLEDASLQMGLLLVGRPLFRFGTYTSSYVSTSSLFTFCW